MIPPRVYFHQLQEQQKQLTCGAATGELCSGQLATGHRTNPHYHDASGYSPASSSTATPARLQSSGVNPINSSSASGQQSYQSGDCQLDIESKRLQPTGQLSNSTCIYSDGRTSQLHHQPSQLHHQPSQLHHQPSQLHHQPSQLHHQLTHEQRQQQSNFSCAQQSDSERLLERQLYQQQLIGQQQQQQQLHWFSAQRRASSFDQDYQQTFPAGSWMANPGERPVNDNRYLLGWNVSTIEYK